MGYYRYVYRTMKEDTRDGSRKGKYGSIKYDSVRKGRKAAQKGKGRK